MKETYAKAGVDIDIKAKVIDRIRQQARSTFNPNVLSEVGFFGGLFEFKGYRQPVLVSSTDSVGTKIKIACTLNKHDTVGIDIVNHCVNDIFAGGAEPLFFLDYIGIGKVVPGKIEAIVQGLSKACQEAGCPLIGGEIAEMSDIYSGDDYDLVGFVIGVVEKDKIIDGSAIKRGDSIIGLPSNGLHTNGYTLVRKIFGETREVLEKHYPELGRTLGEELLEPHRCYYNQLKPLLPHVRGMAHITGGGLIGNVPRILPDGLAALFHRGKWLIPPIFQLIQQQGNVDQAEMYRVFNMGIGMVVICSPQDTDLMIKALPGASVVGDIIEQRAEDRVIIR